MQETWFSWATLSQASRVPACLATAFGAQRQSSVPHATVDVRRENSYKPVLRPLLRHPFVTLSVAIIALLGTFWPMSQLGSEFMPPLDEGDLLYMPSMLPGVSITKAKQVLQQQDRIIKSFPEVDHVFGKVGRAQTATDPAPLSMIETVIALKPKSQWRDGMTKEELSR